jgi:Spy/CpxP family protein refolding chaperone
MSDTKFLKIIIIALLLINIATLVFVAMDRPDKGEKRMSVKAYLDKELHFTRAQGQQLRVLQDKHHNQALVCYKASRATHDALYEHLNSPNPDSAAIQRDLKSLIDNERALEWNNFTHFQDIRAICTPEQQQKFGVLIKDALKTFSQERENH